MVLLTHALYKQDSVSHFCNDSLHEKKTVVLDVIIDTLNFRIRLMIHVSAVTLLESGE